jgi:hypothetical protein
MIGVFAKNFKVRYPRGAQIPSSQCSASEIVDRALERTFCEDRSAAEKDGVFDRL